MGMSTVLAYGLDGVTIQEVKETCNRATELYTTSTLNWPNGPLAKPEIFNPVDEGSFNSIDACAEQFFKRMRELIESTSARAFPMYALAFVVVSKHELPDKVTLVVADDSDGNWRTGALLSARGCRNWPQCRESEAW